MAEIDPTPAPEALPAAAHHAAWHFISLSNLVTYGSLAAALLSIHFAAQGALHLMAACWALSSIGDSIDGAFARLFKRSPTAQAFGQELDSLTDAVAFGLAPIAGLLLVLGPKPPLEMALFGTASLCYLVALVTRLGHFNIAHRRGETGYVGLPSTEAALALATFLLVPQALPWAWLALLVLAVLMVAPVPIARPRGIFHVLLVGWLAAVPLAHFAWHWLDMTSAARSGGDSPVTPQPLATEAP